MAKKEYKVRKKNGLVPNFFKVILKPFKKKPQFEFLFEGDLQKKAIYVSNHSGASGPLTFQMCFPIKTIPWGAHEMCGNYKSRWNYLYHVFYRQKLHWGKGKAFIIATLFAIISKLLYSGVGLIGTYTDKRLIKTFRSSTKALDENVPLLIFPEDSTNGYIEPPFAYNKGYISMCKVYYKLRNFDVPVYPVYFSKKSAKFVVDKPYYINKMIADGMTDDQINEVILNNTRKLFYDYIEKS